MKSCYKILISVFLIFSILVPYYSYAKTIVETPPLGFSFLWHWLGKSFVSSIGEKVSDKIIEWTVAVLEVFLAALTYFLAIFTWLFDKVIDYNLNTATFDPNANNGFISAGWEKLRDLVSLFFIFIVLIIAIATIIGWETYGVKKALPTLIVVILLINFSLLFARYIIEFSNGLSGFLRENITREGVNLGGTATSSLAELIGQGLSLQKISDLHQQRNTGNLQRTRDIIIGLLFSIFIILLASFVFFTAAITFIFRVVVLWILMILAPVAMFLWALPGTSGYAKSWLNQLLKNAFALPIFIFFLLLIIILLAAIMPDMQSFNINPSLILQENEAGLNAKGVFLTFVLNYFLIIGLFLAALWSAKAMGAAGASTVINFGDRAKGWAMGAMGRGASLAGYGIKSGTEKIAERKDEGRITRGAQFLSRKAFPAIETIGKYGKWVTTGKYKETPEEKAAEKAKAQAPVMSQKGLEYEINKIKERGGYKKVLSIYEKQLQKITGRGIPPPPSQKLSPEWAMEKLNQQPKIGGERAGIVQHLPEQTIKNLPRGFFEEKSNLEAMSLRMRSGQLRAVLERGDEGSVKFVEHLQSLGATVDQVADKLRNMGNIDLANWMSSTIGRPIIKEHIEGGKKSSSESPGQSV